jgi:hypothetical protein
MTQITTLLNTGRITDETLMHRGHDLWLARLKWVAEAK